MTDIQELEQEIVETEATAEGLRESLLENRVADLTDMVTKGGKLKGELKGITPAQFRRYIGRAPGASILLKGREETQRKVPYELSIDQLMSERGYNDIEVFKDAIEGAYKAKNEVEDLWKRRDALISDLNEALQKIPELQSHKVKVTRECPVYEGTKCEALVTQLNGTTVMERRQHPFWRIDLDSDSDGKPEKSFRIRYAVDAHKIVKLIKQDLEKKLAEKRKPPKFKSRQPKLRVRRQTPVARGSLIEEYDFPETSSPTKGTRRVSKKGRKPSRRSEPILRSMSGLR